MRVLTFCLCLFFVNLVYGNDCLDWFRASKLTAGKKGCEMGCSVLPVDMITFDCHERCKEFCAEKLACKPDSYWIAKIKDGRPKKWESTSEKTRQWAATDKDRLSWILSKLPDEFKNLSLGGIYRMERSGLLVNPGSSVDDVVVLYDSAFDVSIFKLDHIIVHELSHLMYSHLSAKERKNYANFVGWKIKDLQEAREGGFVNSNSKISAAEDFASNLEFFLLEPDTVKSKVPKAYTWISKNLPKLKIKKDCRDEK